MVEICVKAHSSDFLFAKNLMDIKIMKLDLL